MSVGVGPVMLADESVGAVNCGDELDEQKKGVVVGRQLQDKHRTRNAGQTQTR